MAAAPVGTLAMPAALVEGAYGRSLPSPFATVRGAGGLYPLIALISVQPSIDPEDSSSSYHKRGTVYH